MASPPEIDDGKVVSFTGRRCPICRRPAIVRFRPFCSGRCADIDLGRWLKEEYRVASDEKHDGTDFEEP